MGTNSIRNFAHRQNRTYFILSVITASLLFVSLSSCSNQSSSALTSAASSPTVSVSTAETTNTDNSPTPTSAPQAKYTFDLSQEVQKSPPDHQLAFLSNADGAVIFGGEKSPLYIDGTFGYSEVDSMWSPLTGLSFHQTSTASNIAYDVAYSMDKTSVAFVVSDSNDSASEGDTPESDSTSYHTRTLMYFDGSKEIAIESTFNYFCISSDGSTLAYNTDSGLYIYDCIKGESIRISDKPTDSVALSPTGKSISYCVPADEAHPTINYDCYYLTIGSEPVLIGASCVPVALSDDASVVYFYTFSDGSTSLCVLHNGNIQTLDPDCSFAYYDTVFKADLIFNYDCTQIVFHSGQKYFFSMSGGEPVEAAGGMVVDRNSKYYVNDSFARGIDINGQYISPYFVSNKNLCNLLFQDGTSFTYFDENFGVHTFQSVEYMEAILSAGGSALLYCTKYTNTYPDKYYYSYVSDYLDPACVPIELADKYIWMAILTSNDTVYYRNDIGQLFMVSGSNAPAKIDTYVSDIYTMDIDGKSFVYYLKDASSDYSSYTLCRIEDSTGAKPVVIDTNVVGMDICDAGLVYYKNMVSYSPDGSTKDIYFAVDGQHGHKVFTLRSVGA